MQVMSVLLLFAINFFLFADEGIGHECGLALVRLRNPLAYYAQKYGNPAWGAYKLCSLIEEQRNRGQDGAGMAVMKFDMRPGELYLRRIRNADQNSVDALLQKIFTELQPLNKKTDANEVELKSAHEYLGEIYLGHVRYGTHSANTMRCCQPYICKNSVASKTFALAGNFNMTNSKALCEQLVQYGLCPTSESDTQVILELVSYCLKQEHIRLAAHAQALQGKDLAAFIAQEIDVANVLRNASASWDGGYVFAGILGNGDAFVCRDPAGIRPGFFFVDDEVVAAASERTALMNAFDVEADQIQEIDPGHVLVIKKNGAIEQHQFCTLLPVRRCSFERIYFSRGNDPDIYQERKALGKNLAPSIMRLLGDEIKNAVFTYVPNSSEYAFMGMIEELRQHCMPRVEKLIHKNQRLRTFIANDKDRTNLVAHLYTMTRGIVDNSNVLVVIDDSIVRGTTLRESIIKELASLHPKRIVFVSSAPPILYPDCYGIDLSQIGRFIAFRAAIQLLKETGRESVLDDVYQKCLAQKDLPAGQMKNYVQEIYAPFTLHQLSSKIAQLARPQGLAWQGQIDIVYQTLDGLHAAMPEYSGDWYFTGNYPTAGGYQVLNTSYLQWYEGSDERAY